VKNEEIKATAVLHDDDDGNDGQSGCERLASLRSENDGVALHPDVSSQASFASWEEVCEDE
jgi:hypothetical protein